MELLKEQTSNKKITIDSATLLTITPGALYLSSYLFNDAQFKYYRIPSAFNSTNLDSVLTLGGWAFLFSCVLAAFIKTYLDIRLKITKRTPEKMDIIYAMLMVILTISTSIILGMTTKLALWLINVISFTFTSLFLCFQYIYNKNLSAKQLRNRRLKAATEMTIGKALLDDWKNVVLMILILLPIFSAGISQVLVKRKREYILTGGKDKVIILCKSDQYFYGRRYDEKNRTMGDSIIIIKMPENGSMTLGIIKKDLDLKKFDDRND